MNANVLVMSHSTKLSLLLIISIRVCYRSETGPANNVLACVGRVSVSL